MSVFNHYKYLENKIVHELGRYVGAFGNIIWGFFRTAVVRGKQRITVMVIPDSQTKISSFGFSVFSLIFVGIFLAGIIAVTVVSRIESGKFSGLISLRTSHLVQSQASLQKIEDPVAAFAQVADVFRVTMNRTMETVGLSGTDGAGNSAGSYSVAGAPAQGGPANDAAELQNILDLMKGSVNSLQRISTFYTSHSRVLTELPTMWPVQGGNGVITTNFGPAIQPFTHSMYLHLGVDIAYSAGTPLLAAGDGVITEVAYQPLGYGNYVMIRHGFGFFTRYAHMRTVYVHVGQQVKQGQVIGLMGSTGLSTGPHVHFEIDLGDQVIDPMSFLGIGHEFHATAISQD